ncbi:DUF3757 domain-containing protein [Pseudomonas gingeri]|uniref:DUF3757 domain-containing protein n=1 Tax=Pseudomonas gingeri TaxID=117681 RepID=UPI0015A048DB|nr:DUF3757 domain-containing protein [Pseudomonas gingeri]NVZ62242.1 DUF3757 domain-containing protein [Pseudomonas gingeri]NVZ74689.1 DUF3757 domain-containing protein [Pseudomonas gingeri]
MQIKITLGLIALALFTGNVYADIATCPHIATIRQYPLEEAGFRYEAPGPESRTWTGENEYADESYLAAVHFANAKLNTDTQAVICSYEGEGDAGVRVALKPFNQLKPAPGTAWQGQDCTNPDISRCSFEYMK